MKLSNVTSDILKILFLSQITISIFCQIYYNIINGEIFINNILHIFNFSGIILIISACFLIGTPISFLIIVILFTITKLGGFKKINLIYWTLLFIVVGILELNVFHIFSINQIEYARNRRIYLDFYPIFFTHGFITCYFYWSVAIRNNISKNCKNR